MIDATKARFETKFRNDITKYENEIEKEIFKSIEKGKFFCQYAIDCREPNEIKNQIVEDLKNLGYKASITNYNETFRNAPCDQRPYYDDLNIDWSEK